MKSLSLVSFLAVATLPRAQGLVYPVDVALDEEGVVYIADHEAHALLKLHSGALSVVAEGKGLPRTPLFGIRHIAFDDQGGFIASDPATMKLYRIDEGGNISPMPDDDRLVTPWGVAVEDSGAVLVVDRVTERLRRILPDGTVSEVATIRAPRAILFDKEGGILVLTDRNLEKVSGTKSVPQLDAPPFEFPHDAVYHPNGNLYVSDGYAPAIWKITPDGEVSPLVRGSPLESPQGLAVDKKGNLLVADPHAKSIFLISPKGEVSVLAK